MSKQQSTHQPEVLVVTSTYSTTTVEGINTNLQTYRVEWYSAWGYYLVMVVSAFSILCFFPIGIAAFIIVVWAYSEFSKGNIPKAIRLNILASALSTSAFLFTISVSTIYFLLYRSV